MGLGDFGPSNGKFFPQKYPQNLYKACLVFDIPLFSFFFFNQEMCQRSFQLAL